MRKYALLAAAIVFAAAPLAAQRNNMPRTTMVGGQAMYPNKTIVENAVNSADHTTLVPRSSPRSRPRGWWR